MRALDGEVAEAGANAYRVTLPSFDGPLDLLLHLIKKHELDVLDIPIGFVSRKYNEYLRAMEQLSIDLAAEYLVMAATLAYIKSRMLLPQDPNQQEEDEETLEEEQDPRAELVRRLLEYQKYKDAAEQLGSRDVLGRDIFPRGAPNDATIEPPPLAPLSLFKLVDAFEAVLTRAKISQDHQIDFERITISEKIGEISDRLQRVPRLRFEELFDKDVSRAEMIVTFLALLEMTKLRMTNISQAGPLEPIYVELAVGADDFDAVGDDDSGEDVLAAGRSVRAGRTLDGELDLHQGAEMEESFPSPPPARAEPAPDPLAQAQQQVQRASFRAVELAAARAQGEARVAGAKRIAPASLATEAHVRSEVGEEGDPLPQQAKAMSTPELDDTIVSSERDGSEQEEE